MHKLYKTLFIFSLAFSASFANAAIFPNYTTLTKIPEVSGPVQTSNPDLSLYLNSLYKMGVATAAGLAVIMVIWGGIQYITSAAGEGKSGGKERVTSAILGLLLALGSYIILQTINPDLLKLSFNLPDSGVNINVVDSGYVYDRSDGFTGPLSQEQIYSYNENLERMIEIAAGGGVISGKASNFGYNDPMDNGRGSPLLDPAHGSGISTNNTQVRGVALPMELIRSNFGIQDNNWSSWAPVRKAGVSFRKADGSYENPVPIVDIGPAPWRVAQGVTIDETKAVSVSHGGDGPRNYIIVPDAFPNR